MAVVVALVAVAGQAPGFEAEPAVAAEGSATITSARFNNGGAAITWSVSLPQGATSVEYSLYGGTPASYGFVGHPSSSPYQTAGPTCGDVNDCYYLLQATWLRQPDPEGPAFGESAISAWVRMTPPLDAPSVSVVGRQPETHEVTLAITPPPLPAGATIWGYQVETQDGFLEGFEPTSGQSPTGPFVVADCGGCAYRALAFVGSPGSPSPAYASPLSAWAAPAKLDQSISVTSLAPSGVAALIGKSYAPVAAATSGLPVLITVAPSSTGACTVDGAGVVSLVGAGACTLIFDQPGDDTYNAAPRVQQTFRVDIGALTEATGPVTIERPDGSSTIATVGTPIGIGDTITLGAGGGAQVHFADGTSLAFTGPGGLLIDRYVYEPVEKKGNALFSMLGGLFYYVGGLIGKSDPHAVEIDGLAAIGPRGTEFVARVDPDHDYLRVDLGDGEVEIVPRLSGVGTVLRAPESGEFTSAGVIRTGPLDLGDYGARKQQVLSAFQSSTSEFAITTTSLPSASLGQTYTATLRAAGGVAPYKWKRIGKLPRGLKLNAKTGVISGTPKKKTGTFSFSVQARYKTKVKKQPPLWHTATALVSVTVTR